MRAPVPEKQIEKRFSGIDERGNWNYPLRVDFDWFSTKHFLEQSRNKSKIINLFKYNLIRLRIRMGGMYPNDFRESVLSKSGIMPVADSLT